jgi:hypothetical protein
VPVVSYLCQLGRHRLCQNPKCQCECHVKEEDEENPSAPPAAQLGPAALPQDSRLGQVRFPRVYGPWGGSPELVLCWVICGLNRRAAPRRSGQR